MNRPLKSTKLHIGAVPPRIASVHPRGPGAPRGRGSDSGGFPIAVMGKTGTTNEFKDALFVGSTYGPEGITVAVRIGFDDNRSLGSGETGGRVALPVFREIVLRVYGEKLLGPVPRFPESSGHKAS